MQKNLTEMQDFWNEKFKCLSAVLLDSPQYIAIQQAHSAFMCYKESLQDYRNTLNCVRIRIDRLLTKSDLIFSNCHTRDDLSSLRELSMNPIYLYSHFIILQERIRIYNSMVNLCDSLGLMKNTDELLILDK